MDTRNGVSYVSGGIIQLMKTDLAKNTILLTIGALISKGLLFVMLPFFSSWLTTEEFGIYDLLHTYVTLLIPVLTLATGEGVFRYSVEATVEERKKYITNGFLFMLTSYTMFSLILLCICHVYNEIEHIGAFIMLLLGTLLNSYVGYYLRATKQLHIYSFSNAFTVIVIAIMVTYFVYLKQWGVDGILLGYALGYIIGDGAIFFVSKLHKNLSVRTTSLKAIKQLVIYSSPLILNNISWWVMNVSDRTLVTQFVGNAANGIYAIACKIPTLCTALFSMFNVSWQQTASQMIDSDEIVPYLNKVYKQMVRILCSICSAILACNFMFFNFFFEERYMEAHEYVGILVTAAMLLSLSQFYGGVQIALKQPKHVGYTTAIGAVVNVVLNIIFIKYYGVLAAAVTTLIGNSVILLIRKMYTNKIYSIHLGKNEWFCVIIYIYFVIVSYFIDNMVFNFMNFVLAGVFFCVINKAYFIIILKRMLKVK